MRRKAKIALGVLTILTFLVVKGCVSDRATWYGGAQGGKSMANGQRFNPDALTAASWDYPLGSRLKISHGQKSVIVEITDRGGARGIFQLGKTIDLSRGAFSRLALPKGGSINVKIVRVK
jgi:rare lipoprotein A